jgi:hypothetical protein
MRETALDEIDDGAVTVTEVPLAWLTAQGVVQGVPFKLN